jgi:hypothetical protein
MISAHGVEPGPVRTPSPMRRATAPFDGTFKSHVIIRRKKREANRGRVDKYNF